MGDVSGRASQLPSIQQEMVRYGTVRYLFERWVDQTGAGSTVAQISHL